MIVLTKSEKQIFLRWVLENIDETVVPEDERNGDALIYNLIHRILGDNKEYHYEIAQDEELISFREA